MRGRAAATRTSRTPEVNPKLSGKGWVCPCTAAAARTAGSGLRAPKPPAGVQPRLCPCVSFAGPLFNILSTLQSTPCLGEREGSRWTKGKAPISLQCSQAKELSNVHFPSPLESVPAPRVASVCPVTCCTTFCLGLWGKSLCASLSHTTAPPGVYSLKHSALVSFLKGAGRQSPSLGGGAGSFSRVGRAATAGGKRRPVLAGSGESRAPAASAFPWELSITELTINCRKAGNFLRNANYFLYPVDRCLG